MSLKRTLVVTGASSGIGKAIAEDLLNENFRVIGVSRNPEVIKHENYIPVSCDLSQSGKIESIFKDLVKKHPEIDGLISNAGAPAFGHFEQFSFKEIQRLIEVNLLSHLLVTRALIPTIKKNGQGDVVLMGSQSALQGGPQGSLYSAAKFAIRGFSQSLRKECASSNVRVTLVNPGMVRTPFFNEINFEPGENKENAIDPIDIAHAVSLVLKAQPETVFEEINITPLKKVVNKKSVK